MDPTRAKKLPSYDQALAEVLPHVPPLGVERVALNSALGRVLRADVHADRDQPPFDRSAMDGFAVRSGEIATQRPWPVSGVVAAGANPATFENEMAPASVMRIATGAPLPRGADAVVPIEQSVVEGTAGQERVSFIVAAAQPWQNVHRRASDARAGQMVLPAGLRLGPQAVGIAAAVGAVELPVAALPRITLLTTGDEVRPPETPGAQLQSQQIRNSNGPLLAAFLAALHVPLLEHVHVPDEPEQTFAAVREALSRSHLVVTVGGVSVGQRDLLPWAWGQLGLQTVLHGVAVQPGKPVFVARDDCKLVLGLPGNPVSVLAAAHLFLWPVLRAMAAGSPAPLPWRPLPLAAEVKGSSKRQVFRAARVGSDGSAEVIGWHGSGDLVHTALAEGFVRLPLQDEPAPAGTRVAFLPMVGL